MFRFGWVVCSLLPSAVHMYQAGQRAIFFHHSAQGASWLRHCHIVKNTHSMHLKDEKHFCSSCPCFHISTSRCLTLLQIVAEQKIIKFNLIADAMAALASSTKTLITALFSVLMPSLDGQENENTGLVREVSLCRASQNRLGEAKGSVQSSWAEEQFGLEQRLWAWIRSLNTALTLLCLWEVISI